MLEAYKSFHSIGILFRTLEINLEFQPQILWILNNTFKLLFQILKISCLNLPTERNKNPLCIIGKSFQTIALNLGPQY